MNNCQYRLSLSINFISFSYMLTWVQIFITAYSCDYTHYRPHGSSHCWITLQMSFEFTSSKLMQLQTMWTSYVTHIVYSSDTAQDVGHGDLKDGFNWFRQIVPRSQTGFSSTRLYVLLLSLYSGTWRRKLFWFCELYTLILNYKQWQ